MTIRTQSVQLKDLKGKNDTGHLGPKSPKFGGFEK